MTLLEQAGVPDPAAVGTEEAFGSLLPALSELLDAPAQPPSGSMRRT